MWIQVQRYEHWYPAWLIDINDEGVIVQTADMLDSLFVPHGMWGLLW